MVREEEEENNARGGDGCRGRPRRPGGSDGSLPEMACGGVFDTEGEGCGGGGDGA